jgi:methionyl-tRNA formyltransferase
MTARDGGNTKARIGLLILGPRGHQVLRGVTEAYGPAAIAFAVIATDSAIERDYFKESTAFCDANGIMWLKRSAFDASSHLADVVFAIGWRWMVADLPNLVVFHDSLLPRFRGFAPTVNMLVAGETRLGVTAILASERYDEGDILSQRHVDITYPMKIQTAVDLTARLCVDAAKDVIEALGVHGVLTGTPQDHEKATYSLWRDADDYRLDFRWSAAKLVRVCDAVGVPYRGAQALANGELVTLHEVEEVADLVVEAREDHIGKVIFVQDGDPIVVCGSGLLRLRHIVRNGQRLTARDLPFRSRFS